MEETRQSLIMNHHKLVNELEMRYMNFINQLLQQKALIHHTLQQQLYHKLSLIDNTIHNKTNQTKQNIKQESLSSIQNKTENKIENKLKFDVPLIPFVILPITQQNHNNNNNIIPKSMNNNLNNNLNKNLEKNVSTISTKTKPFECSFCKNRFSTKKSLARHNRFHTGEKPFKCSQCNEGFVRSDYLKKHIKKIHSNINKSNKNNNKILVKLKCNICNKQFDNKYDWNKHQQIHQQIDKQIHNIEKSFQCKH
eukprot:501132_1